MLNGTYDITLRSQLGPRHGTLTIVVINGLLCGHLNLLGFENSFDGGTINGYEFYISMEILTLLGTRSIKVSGALKENSLCGTVEMGTQLLPFVATKKGN